MRIDSIPITSPSVVITGETMGETEYLALPSGSVVLVALTALQAGDLVNEKRSADWICDLTSRLESLVASGALEIEQSWDVSGVACCGVPVSGIVIASNADDARDKFSDEVKNSVSSFTSWYDVEVDEVDISSTERS